MLAETGVVRRDPSPPVFSRAVAWAECAAPQAIPIGDHRCYVGQVLDLDLGDAMPPLANFRGRLRGLGPAVAPVDWLSIETADLAAVW